MFAHDQEIVSHLLNENSNFRRLFDKHGDLKKTVQDVHEGNLSVDEFELENMKKEKLHLKDRMSKLIEEYKEH